MTQEAGPRLRAKVVSVGETLSVVMGVAIFASLGHEIQSVDLADILQSVVRPQMAEEDRYLEARFLFVCLSVFFFHVQTFAEWSRCAIAKTPKFSRRVLPSFSHLDSDAEHPKVLTHRSRTYSCVKKQQTGDVALLGRGGSDTSAALAGALLNAVRVEIWTDVHGIFSCDPRQV